MVSYGEHPAGLEHDLVFLLNGVAGAERPRFEAEFADVKHKLLVLDDPVQDLAAYAQAIARLSHDRLCFLNSHSAILADDWLAKLDQALDGPRTGLVGATGSWASNRSAVLNALLLPNAYRGVIPKRRLAREAVLGIELERSGEHSADPASARRSITRSVLATLRTLPPMPEQLVRFEGFPAQHLRTNAFMADRATFARLRFPRIRRKMDAYLLESGRGSLTRQVQGLGLRTLVVARDGSAFEPDAWPSSRTLWQGDQEGLMIADNQTRMYENGDIGRRRLLSAFAWGRQADPTPPEGDTPEAGAGSAGRGKSAASEGASLTRTPMR